MKSALIAGFALIAGLTASACDTLVIPSARTISKIESRQLPPKIVTDRIVRQLAEVLLTTPHDSSGPRPRYPLQDLWFWTVPRATGIAELCRTDRVIFYFSAALDGEKDADLPTRVDGVSATPRYHFVTAPLPNDINKLKEEKDEANLRSKCRRLNPEDIQLIEAGDEDDAWRGTRLFIEMIDQKSANESKLHLDCYAAKSCRDGFWKLTFRDISSISRCQPKPDRPNTICTRYSAGAFRLDVHWNRTLSSTQFLEIDADISIFMWHERKD